MKKFFIHVALMLLLSSNSFAQNWQIDKKNSKIEFSGSHMNNKFIGEFKEFGGEINFDKDHLKTSFAKIKINLKSIMTGSSTYDKTLPQEDWFNLNKDQFATFETSKISKIKDDKYKIEGFLKIRNIKIAHNFEAIIKINGNKANLKAQTNVNRLDFDLGKASDNSGDWVSLKIPLNIEINATKINN